MSAHARKLAGVWRHRGSGEPAVASVRHNIRFPAREHLLCVWRHHVWAHHFQHCQKQRWKYTFSVRIYQSNGTRWTLASVKLGTGWWITYSTCTCEDQQHCMCSHDERIQADTRKGQFFGQIFSSQKQTVPTATSAAAVLAEWWRRDEITNAERHLHKSQLRQQNRTCKTRGTRELITPQNSYTGTMPVFVRAVTSTEAVLRGCMARCCLQCGEGKPWQTMPGFNWGAWRAFVTGHPDEARGAAEVLKNKPASSRFLTPKESGLFYESYAAVSPSRFYTDLPIAWTSCP